MSLESAATYQPFRDQLETAFAQFARRPALTYQDVTWTYAELDARTRAAAAHLRGQGLRAGERVILYTADKRALLLAHLGAIRAGGVSLPLNFKFTPREMQYYAQDSGAALAVGGDAELPVLQALVEDEEIPLRGVLQADEFLKLAPQPTAPLPAAAAEDWALLLYSSGTTGQPKGVVHTHANLGAAVRSLADCWAFAPDDVLVNVLPFFHIHGISFASHVNFLTGAHMLMADQFHPIRTLDLIDRATVFMAIPPMYYQFLGRPEFRAHAEKWSHVRLFTCGSAPIRPEVLPELEGILKSPLINRYGMTESHVIASLPIDRPSVQGSVGLPLDGVEMTMVEDGSTTKDGHAVGEVHVRGPVIFDHYLNRPEATAEAFAHQGFFATGDLGFVDPQGYLTLIGRKVDLIITKGFNVYPPMVERVLNDCPGVKESAVFGLPDDLRGEKVVAVVVKDPAAGAEATPRAIRDFCRERSVDYQVPSDVHFVQELPRNTMGKVLKRELRDGLLADMGAKQ